MTADQDKAEALTYALKQFVNVCDEAEALVGHKPLCATEVDYEELVQSMLPQTIDPQSVQGTGLKQLQHLVEGCTKCKLSETRTHTVFGEGVIPARLMVIGEGPGAEEDASGRAFVGKAGKYLDSWLGAISMSRETNVYIANIVKCRPPENRNPEGDEVAACLPYLKRQIQLVKPHIILLVGAVACHALLQTPDGVGKLRGRFFRYEGIPVVATYHPAGVLRNEELKRPVWEDLKKVAAYLAIPLNGRS